MTKDEIRAGYLEELNRVAPDIDPADVGDDDHIQDDLELDSMDVLNLVTALHERFGVDIPEADYPRVATADAAAAYLAERLARYKIPKEFHVLDQLPRTAYGKVVKPELVEWWEKQH